MSFYRVALIPAACGFFFITNSYALETNYSIGYLATYSDNIGQASSDELSDVLHVVAGELSLREENRLFSSDTRVNLQYGTYQDNTFGDELSGTLASLNRIWISPRRLRWQLDDHVGYIPIDNAGTDTPDNYQQTNLFSTGPTLTIGLTAVDDLELEARYENYYEEKTNADSEQNFYALRVLHRFSTISTLGLNYEYVDYTFKDQTLDGDYVREDGYFRYEKRSDLSRFYFEFGQTRVDRTNNPELEKNRTRAGFNRRVRRNHLFSITYRDELSDAAQELGVVEDIANPSSTGVLVSNSTDVVDVIDLDMSYNITTPFQTFNFRVFRNELDYTLSTADEDSTGAAFDYFYRISNQHSAGLSTSYAKNKFSGSSREDDLVSGGLFYNYNLTRSVTMGVAGYHVRRGSTDPTETFEENLITFNVRYQSSRQTRQRDNLL